MNRSDRNIGFLISALLHFTAAAVVVSSLVTFRKQATADRDLGLSLAMFKDVARLSEPEEIPAAAPQPAPIQKPPPKFTPPATPLESSAPPPVVRPQTLSPPIAAVKPIANEGLVDIEATENVFPTMPTSVETEASPEFTSVTAPAASAATVIDTPDIERALKQEYLQSLVQRFRQEKFYPIKARRYREEGEVTIAFVIEASGRILDIQVTRSSGFSDLDQAAVTTLQRISPYQPLPQELALSHWQLAIPITYELN